MWVPVLSALLTPTIAVAGIVIAVLNYLHARRKRKDDLFDRRYRFYRRVRAWWLTTGTGAAPGEVPFVDLEDVIPIAEEARLLFGKDIERHILNLVGPGHSGSPFFPNSEFTKPFDKYLRV